MTERAGRPLAIQLALVVIIPLVVLLILVTTWPGQVDAQRRADDTALYVRSEIDQRLAAMRDVLAAPPLDDTEIADPVIEGPLAGQLEGMALFDRRGLRVAWWGNPATLDDPSIPSADRDGRVRKDGILTRLILSVGGDVDGQTLVATWILDSNLTARRFAPNLPRPLRRDTNLQIRWYDTDADPMVDPTPWSREADADNPEAHGAGALLTTPAGNDLGYVWVVPTPAAFQKELRVRESLALAVALLVGGLAIVIMRGWRLGWVGVGWPLAVIVFGRLGLAVARSPFELLPRDLGSARLWGVFPLGTLMASPADLLLTTLAIYLLVRILLRQTRSLHGAVVRGLYAVLALGLGGTLWWLTRTLAEDARIWLLESGPPVPINAQGLLVASLALWILAICRLLLAATGSGLIERIGSGRRSATVVLAVVLSAGVMISLQARRDGLALERLRTEVAPQIVEQDVRRSAALTSALEGVRDHFRNTDASSDPRSSRTTFLAYHFWMRSELASSGYKSSLEFYNVNDERFSQFGFDLPLFIEPRGEALESAEDAPILVYEEDYVDAVSRSRALLHGETSVWRDGERLGRVVGHILDEPENLPFQPAARPYLQALGTGFMDAIGDAFRDGPQHVLYDTFGSMVMSSVDEAPAWSQELREAGLSREEVAVSAGERDYRGFALEESGRLHLLLLPERTTIERLAGVVRLALAVVFLFIITDF
ncbi:MAG: hypothetical protein OEV00_14645, partial [Acidobacteriota bacterium]|nr:hypothetical protein [Acidobacteriota bacterium]